jgi:nucleoside-diphosphate-sugar epimerase
MLTRQSFFSILLLVIHTSAYNIPPSISSIILNRRDALTLAASNIISTQVQSFPLTPNNPKPICVIGASGATGSECVKTLAEQHQLVRAVSRTPLNLDTTSKEYIQHYQTDITSTQNINKIIKGTSAVIFVANAMKYKKYEKQPETTQTYEYIDVHSLKKIAKSCILYKVPRLVFVSASCRSCNIDTTTNDTSDDTYLDKMSGITCHNCRTKQMGESIIKELYKSAPTNIDYTIVRVGFIINTGTYSGERRGPAELEINQDFTKSGMISKYDLADLCINAATSSDTARTTFEAYYRDTAQPYDINESLKICTSKGKSIEECFFGESFKTSKPRDLEDIRNTPLKGSIFATGAEHIGASYPELFKGLKPK